MPNTPATAPMAANPANRRRREKRGIRLRRFYQLHLLGLCRGDEVAIKRRKGQSPPRCHFKIYGVVEGQPVLTSKIENRIVVGPSFNRDRQHRKASKRAGGQRLGNPSSSLADQHGVSDFEPPMNGSPDLLLFGALPGLPRVLIVLVRKKPAGGYRGIKHKRHRSFPSFISPGKNLFRRHARGCLAHLFNLRPRLSDNATALGLAWPDLRDLASVAGDDDGFAALDFAENLGKSSFGLRGLNAFHDLTSQID